MTFLSYMRLLSASCVAAGFTVNPALAGEVKEIEFSTGQRLSIVLPDNSGADAAAQEAYLKGIVELSAGMGLEQNHSFAVERVIIGEHQPQALAIYSWPGAKQSHQLRNNVTYQSEYEPMLVNAWKEILTVDIDLVEPLSISFDEDKVYTLAIAWIADEPSFESYVAASAPVREVLGARPVMNLPVSEFSSINNIGGRTPDRVVIMEWKDASHPDAYRTSAVVQSNSDTAQRAFDKLEWFELSHWEGY